MPGDLGTATARSGDDLSLDRLVSAYQSRFSDEPAAPGEIRVIRAPGRVNLIGEHTDYNQGLVLPAAIDLEVRIAYRPTMERRASVTLLATGETGEVELDDPGPRRGDWRDYLAGVAWALASDGHAGLGFRGVLASTLPVGSGLSSSAAIELAFAWALSGPSSPSLDPRDLAVLCQRAENEYVGVRCGLMDQYAAANGVRAAAILLDCRATEHRVVRLPDGIELVVAHTGKPRRLESSAYNERRAECQRAVSAIADREPSVRSLRDVDEAMLDRNQGAVDETADRRARHVIRENGRVLAMASALETRDLEAIGRLMAESHASLRDLFEVSSPELDALVEIASATTGVIGSRMTGAGFGGCTISLVHTDHAQAFTDRLSREYELRTGIVPRVWTVRAVDGAGVVGSGIGMRSA